MLSCCILWSPGSWLGGSWVSARCFVAFTHLSRPSACCLLFCSLCFAWWPLQCMAHKMSSHQYPKAYCHSIMAQSCFFGRGCVLFCFVWFVVFLFCLCVVLFIFAFWLFCFVLLMRPWNTYRTMYRSAIAFFWSRLQWRICMRFTNSFTYKYNLVERPGESYEGVGQKKDSHDAPLLRLWVIGEYLASAFCLIVISIWRSTLICVIFIALVTFMSLFAFCPVGDSAQLCIHSIQSTRMGCWCHLVKWFDWSMVEPNLVQRCDNIQQMKRECVLRSETRQGQTGGSKAFIVSAF